MTPAGLTLMGWPLTRVVVPLLVLLILAMMVLPLPPFLLDVLLTLNIALAMLVLLASLNARRPLDFSVFPTVLLLTTLLRLALNVASTRLILMEGHTGPDAAGKVIESFGNFLVGGNAAVGFVVFVILVVINFVVITKGAGRIAEVAARFTLDSMPGKQLAVDADLQAGHISEAEARARRAEINRESDFYGAMDGASKFVRGDAVAGVVILAVNLMGGIAVGLIQHDLGMGEALARYAMLTVGDGLVTQIPALIISTAAGIVVSRTSSEQDLSREFSSQVFGRPQTLLVAAAVLGTLGLIPGTPHVAFLLIACVLAAAGVWLLRRRDMAPPARIEAPAPLPTEVSWTDIPLVDVLALDVGYRLVPLIDREQGDALARITAMRRAFALDMGLVVPPVHVRDDLDLKSTHYRVTLKGVEVLHGALMPERRFAADLGDVLGHMDGEPGTDPLTDAPGVWIDPAQEDDAALRGFVVFPPAELLARAVERVVREHAAELLGRAEVQQLIENVSRTQPGLVEEVTPTPLPVTTVQAILARLIDEGVPIRDTRTIFETLATCASRTRSVEALVEYVRAALGRLLVERLFPGAETLEVLGLEAEAESRLLGALREEEDESWLDAGLVEALAEGVREAFAAEDALPGVLLVSPGLRPVLARSLRRSFPGLAVLSHAEIPVDKTVRVVAELRLAA